MLVPPEHQPTFLGLPIQPQAASQRTCPAHTPTKSTTHRQEGVVCCADLCLSDCRSSRGLGSSCCRVCHAATDSSKGGRGQGRACCCRLLGIGHRQGVAPGACCSTAGVGRSRYNSSSTATHDPLGTAGGAGCCSCARAGCLQEHDLVRVRGCAACWKAVGLRGGFRCRSMEGSKPRQTEPRKNRRCNKLGTQNECSTIRGRTSLLGKTAWQLNSLAS